MSEKLSKDELIKGLDLIGEYSKFDTKWKKQIRQLIEAPEPSEKELKKQTEELANFLLEYFPHELKGEGAVELAIRLLGKLHLYLGAKEKKNVRKR